MPLHPIASSIVRSFAGTVDQSELTELEEFPGFGVRARWRGAEILVGSRHLLQRFGIELAEHRGQAGVYVAKDGAYAGSIALVDEPKEGAKQAVQSLKAMGAELVMLTGDSAAAARQTGEDLGIARIRAELLPHEKVEELEKS